MRLGGRDLGYAWHRSSPGARFVHDLGRSGNGTPDQGDGLGPQPGVGRGLTFSSEILVPAIAPLGTANFFASYGGLANPPELLPILEWERGAANLGAFSKHNLVLLDAIAAVGSGATDAASWQFSTTQIETTIFVDDGSGGHATAFKSLSIEPVGLRPHRGGHGGRRDEERRGSNHDRHGLGRASAHAPPTDPNTPTLAPSSPKTLAGTIT